MTNLNGMAIFQFDDPIMSQDFQETLQLATLATWGLHREQLQTRDDFTAQFKIHIMPRAIGIEAWTQVDWELIKIFRAYCSVEFGYAYTYKEV